MSQTKYVVKAAMEMREQNLEQTQITFLHKNSNISQSLKKIDNEARLQDHGDNIAARELKSQAHNKLKLEFVGFLFPFFNTSSSSIVLEKT